MGQSLTLPKTSWPQLHVSDNFNSYITVVLVITVCYVYRAISTMSSLVFIYNDSRLLEVNDLSHDLLISEFSSNTMTVLSSCCDGVCLCNYNLRQRVGDKFTKLSRLALFYGMFCS